MVATAEQKKVRYHNRDTNTFAWATRDELPDYALDQEGVQKQLGTIAQASMPVVSDEKVNDYSADIEQWLAELRTAVADRRAARDENQVFRAINRAEQFKMAVDIYRAAEYIPAENVQFGCYRADFHFRVPPRLPEYDDISPLRRGAAHRYITADPVEIAYLRTMPNDFTEVPVGYVYSRAEGKKDGIWVPFDLYQRQKAIGQAV